MHLISSEQSLTRRLAGLQRRLDRLHTTERRFSWYRLAAFLVGAFGLFYAVIFLDPTVPRWVFLAAVSGFGLVAYLHRRLERSITCFEILIGIRRTQLARLEPDWKAIPLPPAAAMRSALDIDLDLSGPNSLHHLLDLAVSYGGSSRLQNWLTNPEVDLQQIHSRQAIVIELAGLPRFRDRLLLNLRLVSRELLEGRRLTNWLDAPFPATRLKWLLLISTLGAVLNISLFLLNLFGYIPPYWPLTFLLYFAFYNYNAPFFKPFLEAVTELDRELDSFRILLQHLETFPLGRRPQLSQMLSVFRNPDDRPSKFVRRIKWVTAGVGLRSNPIIGLLLNLLSPWDYFFALLAGGLRQKAGQLLPLWLETWYDLEALSSLADFAYFHPDLSFPEIDPYAEPIFRASSLGHPLIPMSKRCCNDFTIQELGEVFIITGSNMAGKSTFLKTLGINLCLAYAGGPVCARELKIRPFRIASCMQISDSLVDGWSFFFAEVKCLKSLLDALQRQDLHPLLYLVDELFRGTNNRERLIGSQAYINALIGACGAGLIATHDLELARFAQESPLVHNFHFREQVEDGRLVFDYQIRPGPSPSTNALRIMEMQGLPVKAD